jgi:O-antigen/teichoic acid export membrane protein
LKFRNRAADSGSSVPYVAGHLATVAVGALLAVAAARWLGTEDLGRWQLGAAIGIYVSLAANPGLDKSGIAEIGQGGVGFRNSETVPVFFRLVLTATLVLVVAGLAFYVGAAYGVALVLFAAAGQALRSSSSDWIFVAQGRLGIAAAVLVAPALLALGGFVLLHHFGPIGLALAHLAAGLIVLVVVCRAVGGRGVLGWLKRAKVGHVYKRSRNLGLSRLLSQFNANLDFFFVAALLGSSALGVYALIYRFVSLGFGVAAALQGLIIRSLTLAPEPRNIRRWLRSMSAAGLVAMASVLFLYWLALPLVGSEFRNDPVAVMLAIALPFQFRFATIAALLIAVGRAEMLVAPSAAAATVNLSLNLALMPTLGLPGAAAATLLGSIAALAVGTRAASVALR